MYIILIIYKKINLYVAVINYQIIINISIAYLDFIFSTFLN